MNYKNWEDTAIKKKDKGELPQVQFYYNNIRFIDKKFWKEVKFIRDVKSINPSIEWFKVNQIIPMIIKRQK